MRRWRDGAGRAGLPLVGGYVHAVAQAARDGQLLLAPLGRFIGEPGFGPLTQTLLGAFEGAVFGAALAYGLTRRPARRTPTTNDQRPTTNEFHPQFSDCSRFADDFRVPQPSSSSTAHNLKEDL